MWIISRHIFWPRYLDEHGCWSFFRSRARVFLRSKDAETALASTRCRQAFITVKNPRAATHAANR